MAWLSTLDIKTPNRVMLRPLPQNRLRQLSYRFGDADRLGRCVQQGDLEMVSALLRLKSLATLDIRAHLPVSPAAKRGPSPSELFDARLAASTGEPPTG
jgi:hypothetical protein